MIKKTFFHKIEGIGLAKFTILNKTINESEYFYSKVVLTNIEPYMKLSEMEKNTYLGINVTDGNQNCIYYKDISKLENDLKVSYGFRWLNTECKI